MKQDENESNMVPSTRDTDAPVVSPSFFERLSRRGYSKGGHSRWDSIREFLPAEVDDDYYELPFSVIHSTSNLRQFRDRQTGRILPRTAAAHERAKMSYGHANSNRSALESVFVNHRYSPEEERSMARYQGVTYLPPNNACYRKWLGIVPHVTTELDLWMIFGVIGFFIGVLGFLIHQTVELILDFKWNLWNKMIFNLPHHLPGPVALLFIFGFNLLLTFGAAFVVVFYRPSAQGSGMPVLIAYLNGTLVTRFLHPKTLVAKFISCVLGVAASLPIGPEGPMIHMGAIVGSMVSNFSLCSEMKVFQRFKNTKDKRNFITAGAAAGIAAAFSAPIGGLLFAMEEVTSFWDLQLGWRVFFCCIVSTLTSNVLNSSFVRFSYSGNFGELLPSSSIILSVASETSIRNHLVAVFPVAILGCIGGIVGAIFTVMSMKLHRKRRDFVKGIKREWLRKLFKMSEPLCIIVVVTVFTVFTPLLVNSCRTVRCSYDGPLTTLEALKDGIKEEPEMIMDFECNVTSLQGFHGNITIPFFPIDLTPMNCGEFLTEVDPLKRQGSDEPFIFDLHYNDLGSILFNSGFNAVRLMFKRKTEILYSAVDLTVALTGYFLLATWASGTYVSSGLVIPMMFMGSFLGRLYGKLFVVLFEPDLTDETAQWWDPGAMAMLGAVAVLAGVTRLTLSLSVMMMEMTNDVQSILNILIVIICAKMVGDQFTHPYYHASLEVEAIPFLHWLPLPYVTYKGRYLNMEMYRVLHVMSTPVLTLHPIMDWYTLEEYILTTTFSGYPVVTEDDDRCFLGLVTREELVAVLSDLCHTLADYTNENAREAFADADMVYRPTVDYLEVFKIVQLDHGIPMTLLHRLRTVCRYKDGIRNFRIDLSGFINTSSLSVKSIFSLHRGYLLFRNMGARHMTVVNDKNQVEGIITRKNFLGCHVDDRIADNWDNSQETLHYELGVKGGFFSSEPGPLFELSPKWDFITNR